jgi:uncharacterized protein (DUF433 family)
MDDHGVIRIAKTRVTLESVILSFQNGATAEEITQQYPSLELADVYSVIAYYLRKRPDVDIYLQQRSRKAKQIQKKNESLFDPVGIRERLLARQAQ